MCFNFSTHLLHLFIARFVSTFVCSFVRFSGSFLQHSNICTANSNSFYCALEYCILLLSTSIWLKYCNLFFFFFFSSVFVCFGLFYQLFALPFAVNRSNIFHINQYIFLFSPLLPYHLPTHIYEKFLFFDTLTNKRK